MRKLTQLIGIVMLVSLMLTSGALVLAQEGKLPLTVGVPVEGEISQDQTEVFYSFEGTAGDVIAISMTATMPMLDSYLELLLPDGSSAMVDDDSGGNLNSLLGPYFLPQDGTYTVRATRFGQAEGGSTGPYSLLLSTVNPLALALNEGVTMELGPDQPFAFFTFEGAEAGQIYELLGTSVAEGGSASFTVSMRDAAGTLMNQSYGQAGSNALLAPLNLQANQRYAVSVVRQLDSGTGIQPDATARVILTLKASQAQTITLDESISGTLTGDAPTAYYQFAGEAGQVLRLDAGTDGSGQAVDIQLMAPSGGYVAGLNSAYDMQGQPTTQSTADPVVIYESGTHLLAVRMFDPSTGMQAAADGTANFTLTLGETQTAVLALGEAITGELAPNGMVNTFRFYGTAGQKVRITLASLDDQYAPSLDVQGISGSAMSGNGLSYLFSLNGSIPGSASFETTLPSDSLILFNVRMGADYNMPPTEGVTGQYSLLVEALP